MFFNYTFKFVTFNTRVNKRVKKKKRVLAVQISSCIVSNNINILIKHMFTLRFTKYIKLTEMSHELFNFFLFKNCFLITRKRL